MLFIMRRVVFTPSGIEPERCGSTLEAKPSARIAFLPLGFNCVWGEYNLYHRIKIINNISYLVVDKLS